MKMRILLATIVLCAGTVFAAPVTTPIADTVYNNDGTPFTGQLILANNAFISPDGYQIPSNQTTYNIQNGVLQINVVPNVNAFPMTTNQYYVATLMTNPVTTEYWMVPNSTTALAIAQIMIYPPLPTLPSTPAPLNIAQGGTGATTVAQAMTNLLAGGATTTTLTATASVTTPTAQFYGTNPFVGFAATSGGTNTAGITASNSVFDFGNGTPGDVSGTANVSQVNLKQLDGILFANQFSGASVSDQIGAACTSLAGANGVVVVSSTMGAGYYAAPANCTIWDLRNGPDAPGSGPGIYYGFTSSPGGANSVNDMLMVQGNPNNSASSYAAVFGSNYATGTWPSGSSATGNAGQATCGPFSGSYTPTCIGMDGESVLADTSGLSNTVYGVYGASSITSANTSPVATIATMYARAPTNAGSGAISGAYSMVAEDASGAGGTDEAAFWSKGKIRSDGILEVDGNVGLPAATSANLFIGQGTGTGVLGDIYCGDGSGWECDIAKRTGSVTTPLFRFLDSGAFYASTSVTTPLLTGQVSGSSTIASSATPALSATAPVNYNVLTANVTSWTLGNGTVDGQQTIIEFCQNATGGFTVAGTPTTVRGFMTIPTSQAANKCNVQTFAWSVGQTAWLATGPGVVGE